MRYVYRDYIDYRFSTLKEYNKVRAIVYALFTGAKIYSQVITLIRSERNTMIDRLR